MDLRELAHVEGEDGTGRLISLFCSVTEGGASGKTEPAVPQDGVIVKNFHTIPEAGEGVLNYERSWTFRGVRRDLHVQRE
jgi:hypothetical protein